MANRRMFSLDVINTDLFLDMPISAQCLYFHLGMRADDDGFVSAPKQIARMVLCSQDDMRILVSKGFIIPFESGVIVIRHWKRHNYIQSDRYKKTAYLAEKEQLLLANGVYRLDTGQLQDVYEADTQVRLGKVRLGKDNNNICVHDTENEYQNAASSKGKDKSYSVHFASFWDMYPRKKEKAKAYKAYNARRKDGYSEEELLTAATAYAKECADRKTEERYIKLPATFLGPSTPFTDYLGNAENGSSQTSIKTTRFSNFEQRKYDFDELEKQLLDD